MLSWAPRAAWGEAGGGLRTLCVLLLLTILSKVDTGRVHWKVLREGKEASEEERAGSRQAGRADTGLPHEGQANMVCVPSGAGLWLRGSPCMRTCVCVCVCALVLGSLWV